MNEIYWITRLDGLQTIFIVAMVCAGVVLFIWTLAYATGGEDMFGGKRAKNLLKSSIITLVVSSFLLVFTPSTKDALVIYGVGGTIDYIKSNDKAKQLPDKVVDALDKYLDSLNEKEEK